MAIKKKIIVGDIDELLQEKAQNDEKIGGYHTTQDVNFREGPGLCYNVICVIPEGETVDATEFSGGWARCTYGDAIGYIMDCYITAK